MLNFATGHAAPWRCWLIITCCVWVQKFTPYFKPFISSDFMSAYFETRTGLGLGPEKKTRTREKPGLVLGPAFEKPGLDNRKPGLQIEKYLVR